MSYKNEKLENFNKNLKNKNIAIIGLGVSNLPLLEYFYKYGAKITVFDDRNIADFDAEIINKIKEYEVNTFFGKDNLLNLHGFDIIFRAPSCLPTKPELVAEKENGAEVTTEIEMLVRLAPCKIIGVTGTEGKTTTTSIITAIIKQNGINCYLGGNIGKPLFTELEKFTPEDIIILELSSFQLMEMNISPEIALVTNVYPDHLNVHKSYEEYQDAKKNIFKHQSSNGITILNKDNEITYSFKNEVVGDTIFFSSKESLNDGYFYDRNDGNIKLNENGKTTILINKSEIKLRGIHNYENICAALAATKTIVPIEKQIAAIKDFTGVEHRLEFVKEIDGVKYYNDSIGTSPASTIAGLNAFDENIVLLAGGSDKGLDYTEIGEKIAEKVGTLILTGPTAEKIETATLKFLNKSKNDIKIYHCKNLEEAVNLSKTVSKSGDIVLLSPASASFDSFKNFIERGNKFKEFVNKL